MTETLSRGRLTERAYEYIRDGILRGELGIGSPLREEELAEALGVSRTPVRQALGLLLQDGLVEVGGRRQLIVRGFSPDRRVEIFLLREALEGVAVRRACTVMDLEEIDYLRVLLMRQRRAASDLKEDAFIELDEEFHLAIARGAQLPILHHLLGQLRGFVRVMWAGRARRRRELTTVVDEHEQIVDALERRDPEEAYVRLSQHLRRSDRAFHADEARRRIATT